MRGKADRIGDTLSSNVTSVPCFSMHLHPFALSNIRSSAQLQRELLTSKVAKRTELASPRILGDVHEIENKLQSTALNVLFILGNVIFSAARFVAPMKSCRRTNLNLAPGLGYFPFAPNCSDDSSTLSRSFLAPCTRPHYATRAALACMRFLPFESAQRFWSCEKRSPLPASR